MMPVPLRQHLDGHPEITRGLPYIRARLHEPSRGTKGLARWLRDSYSSLNSNIDDDREADFCGSPDEICDKIITAYGQMGGFDRLMCYFDCGGLPREKTISSIDLFAKSVIPQVDATLVGDRRIQPSIEEALPASKPQ
jgi:hypothetical protein